MLKKHEPHVAPLSLAIVIRCSVRVPDTVSNSLTVAATQDTFCDSPPYKTWLVWEGKLYA